MSGDTNLKKAKMHKELKQSDVSNVTGKTGKGYSKGGEYIQVASVPYYGRIESLRGDVTTQGIPAAERYKRLYSTGDRPLQQVVIPPEGSVTNREVEAYVHKKPGSEGYVPGKDVSSSKSNTDLEQ